MPPRNGSLKKTNFEPELVEVDEEKETKNGKDINEEKEAKRERDIIYAELLSKPPHGSEVYIGRIPPDSTEEELKEFCKDAGEVVEVRIVRKNILLDKTVYALVSFKAVDMACKAIKELHNSKFKHSRTGMGFACAEYYNHACADYSRNEMMSKYDFKLDSNSPTIAWADPKHLRVKNVYVANLPKDVTDQQLKELFQRHGDIEKVVLHPPKAGHEKRYVFIHFRERAGAIKALSSTERYELNGAPTGMAHLFQAQTNQRHAQMLDDPGASNKAPDNLDDDEEDVDLRGYEL